MNKANKARVSSSFLIGAVCASGWLVSVKAQPPDPVRPATIPPVVLKPVAPLAAIEGVALKSVAPLNVGGVALKSVDPLATVGAVNISASAVKMPPIVAQLRAHTATPQELWDAGAFDADDIVYFVDSLDAWGGFHWDKDPELRRQIVALLVAHGEKQLQDTAKLSPSVRLWLADYFWSVGDEKCVALAESVLGESRGPIEGENPLMFSAVERIAWFYRDKGQHQQCADTWLRVRDYCGGQGWWTADMWIMAARSLEQTGQFARAQELRDKVPAIGDNWLTGLSRYDQALHFMDQGQQQQARQLLNQPLTGPDSTQAWVGFYSLIAESYLKTGETEAATKAAQNALDSYQKLDQPPNGPGFKFQVERARQIVAWCKAREAGAKQGEFAYQAQP